MRWHSKRVERSDKRTMTAPCRQEEETAAAAEAQDLATNIADAAMAVLPEEGEEADLATVGRRIQVPVLCHLPEDVHPLPGAAWLATSLCRG